MDRETGDARRRHGFEEGGQHLLGHLIVDSDAAFHRDFDRRGGDHRGDAVGHKRRTLHQHRAETARLDPVRRAADVQVDLVVSVAAGDPRGLGQFRRVRPAKLQRHRMFGRVEAQQAVAVAMDHRGRCHHLGVKQRMARHLAMEVPAMPVRPVHHRSNR